MDAKTHKDLMDSYKHIHEQIQQTNQNVINRLGKKYWFEMAEDADKLQKACLRIVGKMTDDAKDL